MKQIQLSNDMADHDKAIIKIMAYSKVRKMQQSDHDALNRICDDLGVPYYD